MALKKQGGMPDCSGLFIEPLNNPGGVRGGAGAPPRVAGGVRGGRSPPQRTEPNLKNIKTLNYRGQIPLDPFCTGLLTLYFLINPAGPPGTDGPRRTTRDGRTDKKSFEKLYLTLFFFIFPPLQPPRTLLKELFNKEFPMIS